MTAWIWQWCRKWLLKVVCSLCAYSERGSWVCQGVWFNHQCTHDRSLRHISSTCKLCGALQTYLRSRLCPQPFISVCYVGVCICMSWIFCANVYVRECARVPLWASSRALSEAELCRGSGVIWGQCPHLNSLIQVLPFSGSTSTRLTQLLPPPSSRTPTFVSAYSRSVLNIFLNRNHGTARLKGGNSGWKKKRVNEEEESAAWICATCLRHVLALAGKHTLSYCSGSTQCGVVSSLIC